jgi:hypothetical protein
VNALNPPEQLVIRVRGLGTYGVVQSDTVPLDPLGRFSLMIEDHYCETVWILPPLSLIHCATWWIPLEWVPIAGPLLIGPRSYPLLEVTLEVLERGKPRHEVRVDPTILRESRYKLQYELGRITCP